MPEEHANGGLTEGEDGTYHYTPRNSLTRAMSEGTVLLAEEIDD